MFVTNMLDKHYYTYINGAYLAYGFESGDVGEPRMFGGRIRYNFGK
jgi:iron complex outermembrane receptor protein